MNAIAMLASNMQTVPEAPKEQTKSVDASPLFALLLQGLENQQANELLKKDEVHEKSSSKLTEILIGLDIDISRILENVNSGKSEEKSDDSSSLQLLINDLNINSAKQLEDISGVANVDVELLQESILVDQTEVVKIQNQLMEVFSKFESLLSQTNSQQDIKRIAPKILDLLKQWTALEKQLVRMNENPEKTVEPSNLKINQVWKEVLVAYQNRSNLNSKQIYHTEVTTKDVVKWIDNAMQNQQLTEKVLPVLDSGFQSNTSMPKLEQYVIYINQNQSGQTVEKQLLDQFQQVMKTSKFLSMPNGMNQLSISLRPENLGEMMVRFVELNGEMTVKIVVTTQAAKDMLESNLGQLKHMFSPQQVVIERQDVGAGQGQAQAKHSDEQQSLHSQNQNQSDESEQKSDSNLDGDDFETHLEELIQNEKV
ncbi:flagellar hook-length control protein FliK [Ornithinibacillus californiensis]|uniref:flagellar hook-length control protein FliK n=1 Tax=Ornithinibacillus californiensis TaxID=161536 RepID=UPI00064DBDD2|nr:flagellar hook-length control protein FliK [Ornithinibacillus californiensis]